MYHTVRASNFGPHGNFGPFLASSVASLDESCTKNEQNQIFRSKVFLELLFSSFFCRMRFNDSKPFYKRGPTFPLGPKLRALKVLLCTVFISVHYARPHVEWSYQSILGLLKACLETAATGQWWAEEHREKKEVYLFLTKKCTYAKSPPNFVHLPGLWEQKRDAAIS